jgi:enediyne biosynthesis protein E4
MTLDRFIFMLFCLTLFSCSTEHRPLPVSDQQAAEPPLFELIPASQSGLSFMNQLQEGLNTNILMYEYFYNGAGAATADFNNDGFIDVYFTANMGTNKLFLNRGDLKFEDVTAVAGVQGRPGPWKTGVTHADVNGDGRMDLYVCYSGTVREENRMNQLFINQGNDDQGIPKFEEQAKKYGIASAGYSNQGYFFDYDHDGDLDLLLLNHNPQSLPVLNEVSTKEILKQDDPLRGVRLFKQDNGHFEDVTKTSGISSSALTYALGAGVADIDGDGWEDVYISNDYAIPDYLYMNGHNGKFRDRLPEMMGHTSHFSMGNDVADINNDGRPEVYTLDMLPEDNARQKLLMSPDNYGKFELNLRSGFYYQYMRNMLHVNNADGTFSEIGQLAGVSNTDWSWAALFADFDNDARKDLFVTNGYLRDFTNLDFIGYMDDFVKTKGRLKRQDVLEMIKNMPSSSVTNYIFTNVDGLRFRNVSALWGMSRPSNSNGAAYADFDNDGDLDLVVNNINEPAFLFENKTTGRTHLKVILKGERLNTNGIGATVAVYTREGMQHLQQMPSRGYLSAVSPILHFGCGSSKVVDSLVVNWPSGKMQVLTGVAINQELTLRESDALSKRVLHHKASTPVFTKLETPLSYVHSVTATNDFKRQPQLLNQLSALQPVMIFGDVNGDGINDIFTGASGGIAASICFGARDGSFRTRKLPVFEQHRSFQDAAAAFIDVENDGDLDLYVSSGGYGNLMPDDKLLTDRLYLNDGSGNFRLAPGTIPFSKGIKTSVAVCDFNKDGFADLFVGASYIPGRFPENGEHALLINKGDGTFLKKNELLGSLKGERITAAVWADITNDGLNDLVVAGEWMPIRIFQNNKSSFTEVTLTYFDKLRYGWWKTLCVADLNGDGNLDIVGGNFGLNSQYAASDQQPVELFYADFDQNGSVDPVTTTYIQGKRYPYLTRDELLEQLGFLRSRFNTYKSYSSATLEDCADQRTDLIRAAIAC